MFLIGLGLAIMVKLEIIVPLISPLIVQLKEEYITAMYLMQLVQKVLLLPLMVSSFIYLIQVIKKVKFNPIVSPVIDTPPMNMTIESNANASFSCKASGFPVPLITWFINGEALASKDSISSINISTYEVQSNLTVFMANVSNSGTYSCIATSTADNSNDNATASLFVQGKIVNFYKSIFLTSNFSFSAVPHRPENLTAFNITSRNLSLSWIEPLSNNAPIQNYSVRFMDPSFSIEYREVTTTVEMVDIVELFPGIDYFFTVVAVNEIGESRPSLQLKVRTSDEGICTVGIHLFELQLSEHFS